MLKKSLIFRSRSTEEETEQSLEGSVQQYIEDQSLEDVLEDPESGDSETANEVEVSERALKFKISTECSVPTTGRKSYPGSRKGSRERGQHINHSDLTRMMQQKGKLKTTAYSFDHHFLSDNKKLSFDSPSFLDEYALTLKKKFEEGRDKEADENGDGCVLSKETLNLNKRNSEHSVKGPDEMKSILKYSDNKKHLNVENLRINLNTDKEEEGIKTSPKYNMVNKKYRHSDPSDNDISIISHKDSVKVQSIPSESNKSNKSIFSRFRQFTDRFGLSQDSKVKHPKNNNCTKNSPHKGKKKVGSSNCKSVEKVDNRKASTLPKTKNRVARTKGWKSFILGKEKSWSSDVAVDGHASDTTDNQSLPSTSQMNSNCVTPNKLPASSQSLQSSPRKSLASDPLYEIKKDFIENNVVDKCRVKLQEIKNDLDKEPNVI